MHEPINITNLTTWIEDILEAAKNDTYFSIAWFSETEHRPFSIVAGWQEMFSGNDFSDLFCTSKSHPESVMCVKIIKNTSPSAQDFEEAEMPLDKLHNVDDTCVSLEWDDPALSVAQFFLHEWERIMTEHEEVI